MEKTKREKGLWQRSCASDGGAAVLPVASPQPLQQLPRQQTAMMLRRVAVVVVVVVVVVEQILIAMRQQRRAPLLT